ncbi:hypothetical protein FRX31_018843 [Thalictrum thalictroides]|uniref:Transmembrane protein n=1 Tax=Thalictrum thalictroides TaxID=46969 RepID=A0A7J6W3P3_THATH|nr:hypothetical protein FRX31_018843 [Thalictrum thalictroides]
MATTTYTSVSQSSSQRSVALLLALAAAVVLSPLYVERKSETRYDTKWNSSFYLPMVLGGLIIAIRTTSSLSSPPLQTGVQGPSFASFNASSVFKVGSSSVGLAGVLVMLVLVLSWQNSVQEFFWR